MENWTIPIAIALSFGCVHRMMINIPPTSDVEWMKTVKAKIAMKMCSFVLHLPLSQSPLIAVCSGGGKSKRNMRWLQPTNFMFDAITTHRTCMNIQRNFFSRWVPIEFCSQHGKPKSKRSHRFRKLEQTAGHHKGTMSWIRCRVERKLLNYQSWDEIVEKTD